jgi:hypothetical protein
MSGAEPFEAHVYLESRCTRTPDRVVFSDTAQQTTNPTSAHRRELIDFSEIELQVLSALAVACTLRRHDA